MMRQSRLLGAIDKLSCAKYKLRSSKRPNFSDRFKMIETVKGITSRVGLTLV